MPTAITVRMDKALDGARILWRWFLACDDRRPSEGYVREFSPSGERVRISETASSFDFGEWREASQLRVIEVLEDKAVQRLEREAAAAATKAAAEKAAKKKSHKPRRIEGDEWKDGDETDDLDLGEDGR